MPDPIYRHLQQRLDQYSMGFPATASGIEIEILEKLFSPSDAAVFLQLSQKLETPEAIAPRIQKAAADAADILADMARRGLLFSLRRDDIVRYGAIPFVHGIFEFQIQRMDQALAALVRRYMDEAFKDNLADNAANFLRVIPVRSAVEQRSQVAPYEDAIKILEQADPIVVTDCACRTSKAAIDDACGKPLEVCFMFGAMGQYYLDHEMGRQIELQEAAGILAEAHAQGLVTQPATAQNPSGMCHCCGDCCGPLTALKHHPTPAEMVFSNHFARVVPTACTGCESCLERCQMDAIVMDAIGMDAIGMDDDEQARVNRNRCIGCGLCVAACPTAAIRLEQKDPSARQVPPETTFEQMMRMATHRGII